MRLLLIEELQRREAPATEPRTVAEALQNLHDARTAQQEDPPRWERMAVLVGETSRWIREVGTSEKIHRHFGGRGLNLTSASVLVDGARGAVAALERRIRARRKLRGLWDEYIGRLRAARPYLEILSGERRYGSGAVETAVERWSPFPLVLASSIIAAPVVVAALVQAGPLFLGGVRIVASHALRSGRTVYVLAGVHPTRALLLVETVAGTAAAIAETGFRNWLQGFRSPYGLLQLVYGSLGAMQTWGPIRGQPRATPSSRRTGTPSRSSSGTSPAEVVRGQEQTLRIDSVQLRHAENGRELEVRGGVVRYARNLAGTGPGRVCMSCNPDLYEKVGGRWRRKPRAKAPVTYYAVAHRRPVPRDENDPSTSLGLDAELHERLGSYVSDPAAVARIQQRKTVAGIKAQLAEELVRKVGKSEAQDVRPTRGGRVMFLDGEDVAAPAPTRSSPGQDRAPLTDGMIVEVFLRGGRARVRVERIYEVKSGQASARKLPKQVEWDYERIKELGIRLRVQAPDGQRRWIEFQPSDIEMLPRNAQRSTVHGFMPKDVAAPNSGVTRAYTARALPADVTAVELQEAALLIHRAQRQSRSNDSSPEAGEP